MARQMIAGNWKMHTNKKEARQLIMQLRQGDWSSKVPMVLAVPFTHIQWVSEWLESDQRFRIAAQNCSFQDTGALTGEVSAPMLRDAGATMVIIGHSERRTLFGETDELIRRKMDHALSHNLGVILCIGETLAERDAGQTLSVVEAQLDAGLSGLDRDRVAEIVIAYEPVWAIGTGRTASPGQAQEVHQHIRQQLTLLWGEQASGEVPILYGGSVKAANARELFSMPDIDGGLVGGASLQANEFLAIANSL